MTTRRVAVIVGGAGLASVIAGTVFAAQYKRNDDRARGVCSDGGRCTNEEVARHDRFVDEAKRSRLWTFVGFSTGAALLGGATWLYLSSSGEGRLEANASVSPDGSWSAALTGRF